jgi:hypothetical protein
MQPTLTDVKHTVARLEAALEQSILYGVYKKTCQRFERDLSDPRDLALSKAAALMLIGQFEQSAGAA